MSRQSMVCCSVCLALLVSGCEFVKPTDQGRAPATPPGIAPLDGDLAAPAGGAPVGGEPAANPPPIAQQPAPQPPANDGKGIIGKMTAEVVDVQQAMAANPNLKVVENKSQGDDPISFAASAYVSARSKASLFGFQAWLKQHKIVEERNPTYAEFIQAMRENHVEFTALYAWQKYGYDAQQGAIVILEDSAMKAERYKAAGIDPNQ